MHVVILFVNIGNYHAARINAAYQACQQLGWRLTAIQLTDDTLAHPWGDYSDVLEAPVETLCRRSEGLPHSPDDPYVRYAQYSKAATYRLPGCLDRLRPHAVCIPGWSMPIARIARRWCHRNRALPVLMSETSEHDAPRNWPVEQYKRWLLRGYAAAIVGGKSHQRYLVKLGMAPGAIFGGYDVVDNDFFTLNPYKSSPNLHPCPYFLAVSRFVPKKNIVTLLAAYSDYHQQASNNRWDLLVCGDGPQRPEIEALIATKGLTAHVHLPGFLESDQILPYFAQAACFVHASQEEQWGLVVNEAMAASLPVLVSNRCGCFEDLVMEGVNGFGFDPYNQEQLTDLMLKISSSAVDLQSMGQASLQHIQNYSPDYFAQGLKQAIDYALAHA